MINSWLDPIEIHPRILRHPDYVQIHRFFSSSELWRPIWPLSHPLSHHDHDHYRLSSYNRYIYKNQYIFVHFEGKCSIFFGILNFCNCILFHWNKTRIKELLLDFWYVMRWFEHFNILYISINHCMSFPFYSRDNSLSSIWFYHNCILFDCFWEFLRWNFHQMWIWLMYFF